MIKAFISGTPCTVYDFKQDEHGRMWAYVKCEYYERALPVYAEFIEIRSERA